MRHKHRWQTAAHMDGCHSHTTVYSCPCGTTRSVTEERNIEIDPYSTIWMLDQDCQRCSDLLAGAKPVNRSELVE